MNCNRLIVMTLSFFALAFLACDDKQADDTTSAAGTVTPPQVASPPQTEETEKGEKSAAATAKAAVTAPQGQACAIEADPATFACSSDSECIVYLLSQCPPNLGGAAVAINARYNNEFSKKYNQASCPAAKGCSEGAEELPKASCIDGICSIEK